MEKQKKKRGKIGKASYFVPDGSGSYVYSGPIYALREDSHLTVQQVSMRRLLFSGIITLLSVLCGLLPVQGMGNVAYVTLPYAGGLICTVVSLWKAMRIIYWGKDKLREYVYHTTVERFPVLTLVCALFAGFSIAGEGLRMLLEGVDSGGLPFAIIFLLIQAAILSLALIWRRLEASVIWVKGKK